MTVAQEKAQLLLRGASVAVTAISVVNRNPGDWCLDCLERDWARLVKHRHLLFHVHGGYLPASLSVKVV